MVETKFKQTDIGQIPDDWEVKELEDLSLSKGLIRGPFGGALKKEVFVPKGFKVYEQKNAIYKSIKLGNYYIPKDKFEELNRFEVKTDDFILSCSGTIGKIYRLPKNLEPGIINQALLIIRLNEEYINLSYFEHIFNDEKIQNKIIDDTQGGAMKNLVGMSEFKKTKFPLPPLAEQEAIATALSDAHAWIENLEQLIAKKRLIKQGAMHELLTPKEDWEVKKLGDLTKVFTKQTGFDYSAYIKPSLVQFKSDNDLPFIQNKDFKNKWVNFNTDYFIPKDVALKFPRILLDEKCLLISISGAVGNVGIFNSKTLAFIGGAIAILKFKEPQLIEWVLYYLKSDKGQNKLLGNVKAGSHQNLILDDLRKLDIEFPSLSEQERIATILSDMDAEIEAFEQKLIKAKQIKQGLMQKLLTGRIRLV